MTSITTSTHQAMVPRRTEFVQRPAAPSAGMTAADLFGVVRRRAIMIFFIFVFIIGATIGLTFLWIRYAPAYKASAYIEIQPPTYNPIDFFARETSADLMKRLQANQEIVARSDRVLLTALKDPAVKGTRWYKHAGSNPDEILLQLRDDLRATGVRGTSYLEISMRVKYLEDVAPIVNTVATAYVAEANRMNTSPRAKQIEHYTTQRERLAGEITAKRNAIEAFRRQVNVPAMTQGLTIVGDRLLRLSALVTELDTVKTRLQAMNEQYQNLRPEDITPDDAMISQVEANPRLVQLQTRLSAYYEERGVQNQKGLGPNHPYVKDIDSRIAVIDNRLNGLRQQLLTELRRSQMEQTRISYTASQHQLYLMMEQLEAAKADQADLDRNLATYETMVDELEGMKEELHESDNHIRNLQVMVADPQAVSVRLIHEATKPRVRDAPRWITNIPAGIVLGLMISFGLAFLLEFLDTSVRTPRDVLRHTSMALLGAVPVLDDEEIRIEDVEMATRMAPNSMMAESFRQIRTNLLFSCPAEQQRTILITSPLPADGKTAVAINMAVSVAQGGRRVLLVDANMRRPTLDRAFPQANSQGLSNILVGQGRLENYVTSTDLPNLDILAAGPQPPSPAELLGTNYMREMLVQATEKYDQVIFDGPPVLLVSDALVLATQVDGVVMVCRAKANSRGVVHRARSQLERVGAHILGTVLNAVESTRGGYFRKQYRAFYDYMAEEEEGARARLELPASDAPANSRESHDVPEQMGGPDEEEDKS